MKLCEGVKEIAGWLFFPTFADRFLQTLRKLYTNNVAFTLPRIEEHIPLQVSEGVEEIGYEQVLGVADSFCRPAEPICQRCG